MFLFKKLTILFFILSINTLAVSAEDISKISEETFKDSDISSSISDSSIAKVELFTPIDSLKKHPGSIVLSLKDAILRALSNNVSIEVESFNSMVKKESIIESLSEFDATLGLELSTGRKTQIPLEEFRSEPLCPLKPELLRVFGGLWLVQVISV